jgi:hypothetical protein
MIVTKLARRLMRSASAERKSAQTILPAQVMKIAQKA